MDLINNASKEVAYAAREYAKERVYWLDKLSGEIIKSNFSYDHNNRYEKASEKEEIDMKVLTFNIEGELFEKLKKVSNNSDSRLFMILAAGGALLLSLYTGHDDIIIGVPIYRQEIEGDFINTALALRVQLNAVMSFKELLIHVKETLAEAFENQNYPIETVPYELNIPFDESNDFPLFDTAVLLENIQEKSYISHLNINTLFSFFRSDNGLTCTLDYMPHRYKTSTIKQIFERFKLLLAKCFDEPNATISSLDFLYDEEKKKLLDDFNNTNTCYPNDKTIHRLFEEQVERTPGHKALIEPIAQADTSAGMEAKHLTYKELNEKANQLAHRLISRGITAGSLVCVMGGRSLEMVTGILAVLKSSGTYLPLDAKNPHERNRFIIEDSQASLFLVQGDLIAEQNILFEGFSNQDIIHIDDELIFKGEITNPACNVNPENLAYIIYTSGTTGKPKGVMIPHRALVNYIWWAAETYVKNETVYFPLFTSISFDLTVTSIFTPLITGNAIVVYSDHGQDHQGILIEKILDDNRVEAVKLTPSHLYLIGEKKINNSKIKRFILGGEMLETGITRKIYKNFNGNVEIYNEYGPTEATVGCMIHKFAIESDTGTGVPIGVPIANTRIYLLSKYLKPVPTGAVGEICIGGDGLAAGYLRRPESTSEKFIPSPFNAVNESERLYRTGDIARWLHNGKIEFLGRIDNQVKIRGFRVEVGEIEARLLEHEGIKAAVVMPRKSAGQNGRDNDTTDVALCVYFTSDVPLTAHILREFLSHVLPDYMVPSYYVRMEAIPLTPIGKIDKQALPDPEIKTGAEFIAPRNEIEIKLAKIWTDILGIEEGKIGINDSYFELGGHSLNAMVLVNRIHRDFNIKLSLVDIFRMTTIRELAESLGKSEKNIFAVINPVEAKEYYALSSAQRRFYFAQQINEENTAYNMLGTLTLEPDFSEEKLLTIFKEIIRRHESLRTSFKIIKNEPSQIIHDHVDFKIGCHNVLEENVAGAITNFIKPFDLNVPPLFNVDLIDTGRRKILVVDIHHIISDGISLQILTREFQALSEGMQLAALPVQYKDYASWQNDLLEKGYYKKMEKYWLDTLENFKITKLPVDNSLSTHGVKGSYQTTVIETNTYLKIEEFCNKYKLTKFSFMLSIFLLILTKETGENDITVGAPVDSRSHVNLENLIGVFLNVFLLRAKIDKDDSIINNILKINRSVIDALGNSAYLYEELYYRLKNYYKLPDEELFTILFNYLPDEEAGDTQAGKSKPGLPDSLEVTPKYPVTLYINDSNKKLVLSLVYRGDLYCKNRLDRVIHNFLKFIEIVITHEDSATSDLVYEDMGKDNFLNELGGEFETQDLF